MEFFFMFIGFGFFLFVINLVTKSASDDRRYSDRRVDLDYERRLSEAREFGFEGKQKIPIKSKTK